MSATFQGSWSMAPIVTTALAASGVSATFALPNDALDGCFVASVSATFSGTTPKLDISLETSPDGGTTFFCVGRFLQITAASVINRLVMSFNASGQNTASVTTGANGGNNAVITGSQTNLSLCSGCPIVPAKMRFRFTVTATTPSLTFTMYGWGNRLGRELACG